MKKIFGGMLLAILLCMIMFSAQASQMLNVYINKDALLAHDISAADIRIRPEGMVRVTRHSLWPWDESGEKWSLFVEIENTSEEKIVIDENWLVACKANREEIATADGAFSMTDNVLDPGERTLLYAGVQMWMMPTDYHDVTGFEAVEGLAAFAGKIRRAEILRVRLETRGNASTQNWEKAEVNGRAWIKDEKICFEMINETDRDLAFRTMGVIISDAEGRIMDVLSTSYSRGAKALPGEKIAIEKPLQPYVTEEMTDGAQFETFGFLMAENSP